MARSLLGTGEMLEDIVGTDSVGANSSELSKTPSFARSFLMSLSVSGAMRWRWRTPPHLRFACGRRAVKAFQASVRLCHSVSFRRTQKVIDSLC